MSLIRGNRAQLQAASCAARGIGCLAVLLTAQLGIALAPTGSNAQPYAGATYTAFHNMETFERNGESVSALRIPIYLTLRSWEERAPGLRLRLAASFAATDLFDLLDQQIDEIHVTSFVPGIEFILPIGSSSMLRPYLDAGIGTNDATERIAFLGSVGLRTEFILPSGHFLFGLEPGLQLSLNSNQEGLDNSNVNPFVTLSARHSLNTRIAGRLPDLGAYFEAGYNFAALELTNVTASTDGISNQFEVGMGFGFSHGRPHIGPFAIPRIRVGYRFGDLEGFRIRIGGDWLTNVSEAHLQTR